MTFLLCLSLILGIFGIPILAAESSFDLSGLTAFLYHDASLTVKEGSDTNYEIAVITAGNVELEPTLSTKPDGNAEVDALYILQKSINSYQKIPD